MKKLTMFLLFVAMILVLPFTVYAEGEEVTTSSEDDKTVKVYFFRGEGCSHCAEALKWFDSIQEEYGSKFKLITYETWYDSDNAELMTKVAKARGEEDSATGVPYIIIGDKSWVGFAEDPYASEIKAQIDKVYEQPVKDRYDALEYAGGTLSSKDDDSTGKDVLALLLILIVVAGGCFGIYKAREKTK